MSMSTHAPRTLNTGEGEANTGLAAVVHLAKVGLAGTRQRGALKARTRRIKFADGRALGTWKEASGESALTGPRRAVLGQHAAWVAGGEVPGSFVSWRTSEERLRKSLALRGA